MNYTTAEETAPLLALVVTTLATQDAKNFAVYQQTNALLEQIVSLLQTIAINTAPKK